jgi:TetR/AcrR family transcriptional regulator of autoinduction and epiphytic fitness
MAPVINQKTQKLRLTDRKRQAILDAALVEFDANGFTATSMDRIAATANVSKRTVYNHFESKEVLFEAIRQSALQAIEHTIRPYDLTESLESQLELTAMEHIAVHTSDAFMKFARVSVSQFIVSPEMASASFEEFSKSRDGLVKWIKAAAKDGRLTVAEPKRAAAQFLGLLNVQMFWPQLLGGQKTPSKSELKKIVASTIAIFLDHYQTE